METIGFRKLQFLTFSAQELIDRVAKRVVEETGYCLDLSSLPKNDPDVYALFSNGKTDGVFQFESRGMKEELKRFKPEHFEDLIALIALYRPGIMELIPDYIRRRNGYVEVRYQHPVLEEVLLDTYGIIIYQEQVVQLATKIAGLTPSEAKALWEAIRDTRTAPVTGPMREMLVAGAIGQRLPKTAAEQLLHWMTEVARYGFTKSQCASQALLAYQFAYLKVHYPIPCLKELLDSEIGDTDKLMMYLDEFTWWTNPAWKEHMGNDTAARDADLEMQF